MISGDLSIKIKNKVPRSVGVYIIKDRNNKPIYVGKSNNLRKRLIDHLKKDSGLPLAQKIKDSFYNFEIIKTTSEIEALVIESNLIKKLKPPLNILLRDDKNYFFLGITSEIFPRIFLTHQIKKAKSKKQKAKFNGQYIGPFTSGRALKASLRLLRRIFPFRTCKNKPEVPCTHYYLDLCPAHYKSQKELKSKTKKYSQNLKKLKLFLLDGPTKLIKDLEEKMKTAAKSLKFEKAKYLRDEIKVLQNIMSHRNIIKEIKPRNKIRILELFKKSLGLVSSLKRIEAYDISNLGKDYRVGSMTVFVNGIMTPSEFRKFKIKSEGRGDPQMIYEILKRRLTHLEKSASLWPKPDLILIDGGLAQINFAKKALQEKGLNIELISIAKSGNIIYNLRRGKIIKVNLERLDQSLKNFIISLNKSSHKFAKKYLNKLLSMKVKIK